jgi:hypothetical protein
MRCSWSPFVAVVSAPVSASRGTGVSPMSSVRSDFTVRKTGLSGRGCGWAVEVGRSTATSTVASGAATMKMMSRTRMTSMKGVTLIS